MLQESRGFSWNQPSGLYLLFFTEMWERFSFYGMRALLVLYMTKAMFYKEGDAYEIYGAYGTLVYAGPVIGGLLADRLLGYKNGIVLGGVIMALGHLCMALDGEFAFFTALALIALGNGFFKPNISSTVGQLYEEGDPRRDVGFSIFYMGINIGAFGQMLCGLLGESPNYGWHYGFSLAGIGMIIGLMVFIFNKKTLRGKGESPNPTLLYKPLIGPINYFHIIAISPLLIVPFYVFLLQNGKYLSSLLIIMGLSVLVYLLWQAFNRNKQEREQIFAILVLLVFSILFWSFFEQAGSSLNLFTDKNVDKTIFGTALGTSFFQSINPGFIILLAPVFSGLWAVLSKRTLEPSTPLKFAFAMLMLAGGFYLFAISATYADSSAMVPVAFLIWGYFLHTTGELCISPVGLSMITKLSPKDLTGVMMGAWMLSSAFAHTIGGMIAKLTSLPKVTKNMVSSAHESLVLYSDVFMQITYTAAGAGFILIILSPVLKKWMHGVQ